MCTDDDEFLGEKHKQLFLVTDADGRVKLK